MARGKGRPPKVTKNKELIGAGKTPETVKDINGKIKFADTVGKKPPITPKRFAKPKQKNISKKISASTIKLSSKIVRDPDGKKNYRKTVGKKAPIRPDNSKSRQTDLLKTTKNNPTKQAPPPKAKKVAPPQKKPKVTPTQKPKSSAKNFVKNTTKAVGKSISKGLDKMRNYISKNISKPPTKAKRVIRKPPTKGR